MRRVLKIYKIYKKKNNCILYNKNNPKIIANSYLYVFNFKNIYKNKLTKQSYVAIGINYDIFL